VNKEDFASLYTELRRPLIKFLHFKGLSVQEAEESVQEAFQALYEKLLANSVIENHSAWLYRTAHNRAKDRFKSSEYRTTVVDQESIDSHDEAIEPNISLYIQECVDKQLKKFAERYPEAGYAIELQLESRATAEIAQIISKTPEATRKYLSDMKQKLRPLLEECREA
jgi:DNA-directed RNA polymerase specialized sigma24 family protein